MSHSNELVARKVVHMNDLYNQKAVEHNDLITSVAKMDKVPLKIFELAVSCLNTENNLQNNTIHLSKETLFSFFDGSSSSKHTRFKDALRTLHEQAIFEVKEPQKKKGNLITQLFLLFPEVAGMTIMIQFQLNLQMILCLT